MERVSDTIDLMSLVMQDKVDDIEGCIYKGITEWYGAEGNLGKCAFGLRDDVFRVEVTKDEFLAVSPALDSTSTRALEFARELVERAVSAHLDEQTRPWPNAPIFKGVVLRSA